MIHHHIWSGRARELQGYQLWTAASTMSPTGRYTGLMVKRMLSLLLALAVAGAPAASAACQVACASTMGHRAMTGGAVADTPSCHDEAVKPGPLLSQVPHPCNHDGGLPSTPTIASAQDSGVAVPLALVVTSTAIVAPSQAATLWAASVARSPRPAGLQLAVPMRI
jgi:hypothetical protein